MKIVSCNRLVPGYLLPVKAEIGLMNKCVEEHVRKGNLEYCNGCGTYHPTNQFYATGRDLDFFTEIQTNYIEELSSEELHDEIVEIVKIQASRRVSALLLNDPTPDKIFHKILAMNLFVDKKRADKYMDALLTDGGNELFEKLIAKTDKGQ